MLLLVLCDALVLLYVVEMRREEPPFIGGEEGGLWNIAHSHMEGPNCLLSIKFTTIST